MDMTDLTDYKIFLASQSPRRAELLRQAGYDFTIISNDVEEIYPGHLSYYEVPAYLSKLKADAGKPYLPDASSILISADSIVAIDGKIIGKPKDTAEAFSILRTLSGRIHEVVTGVTLLDHRHDHTFSEVAEVSFYELTDAEIDYYISNFNPLDKAGAYGIQDWIGLCKVREIKGNFSNIMGLPVSRLYHELKAFVGQEKPV